MGVVTNLREFVNGAARFGFQQFCLEQRYWSCDEPEKPSASCQRWNERQDLFALRDQNHRVVVEVNESFIADSFHPLPALLAQRRM